MKRFIPLDKFENELRISSLPSIVLKFRTHQEEKTYVHLMTNTSKRCLLNTDLRSVSNAALRKLWHSYQRFWNAPIVVLIIIMHIGIKIISFRLFLLILKCSNLVFLPFGWLRGKFCWLGFVQNERDGGSRCDMCVWE